MKLKDCRMGEVVIDIDNRLGHIAGFTYNVNLRYTGNMTAEQLFQATIPLVRYADGQTIPIHNDNLEIYNGGAYFNSKRFSR